MKIKTITCHDVYNAGASLQAYALATYINQLGHECEIIDYKPDYLVHYKLTGVANQKYDKPFLREIYNILKIPGRLYEKYSKKKKAFDDFTVQYLPITSKRYTSNEQLRDNLPSADIYIAGSDQIWNCLFMNGRDPAFYLDFAPSTSIKASYAASFAANDIPVEYRKQVRKWVERLDYISVRESSGLDIIRKLDIKNAIQVLDPVFLLTKQQWEKMCDITRDNEPYIFLYDFDRNQKLGNAVKKMAAEKGWKIYSYLPNEYCDKCFNYEGPLGFIKLVKGAKFVVSNSFHATAFSIIFEKDFWVIKRDEDINARMCDLLSTLGLTDRMVKENEISFIHVQYGKVQELLNRQITDSKAFIEKIISAAEGRN